MRLIADLHIHSRFSRATSPSMNISELSKWARIKGISILGTGDFTHPLWLSELKLNLKTEEDGLFSLNNSLFMLTSEVSAIFSVNKIVKKIHLLIFAPSFEIVEQINEGLAKRGNLKADGRPIFGMRAEEIVELVMNTSRDCEVIPAHAWTPWFGIFGANSGFNSVEECFQDQAKHIHALETGLSSDPAMNWRLSALDKYTLISNSDAHSPAKLGREANVFELKRASYFELLEAIRKKDKSKFKLTYEFFPEEGKYHLDGHRDCNMRLSPRESLAHKNICPACGKKITVGVLHRVEELADRPEGFTPENAIPFKSLIPLQEIIADALGKGESTQLVQEEYAKITSAFNGEFNALEASEEELKKVTSEKIAEGVARVQKGKVFILPGYDGVYGEISVFRESKQAKENTARNLQNKQKSLDEFF
ncbi:MAG: endonuclease Q family protein [Candidatus Micrarchaeota archaeon]